MPIIDGKYVSPDWINNKKPALSATELNAMGETLEKVQDLGGLPIVDGVPADAEPGDAWINTQEGISDEDTYVVSFNGRAGQVTPQAGDYNAAMVGLENVANERQYSEQNPPPYPVTSVNGESGAVELDFTKIEGILPASKGGTGVTSLDALANALGGAQIQVGSYTGTGNYGSANPCSVTFNFAPRVFAVTGSNYSALNFYAEHDHSFLQSIDALTTSNKVSGICSFEAYGNGHSYDSYARKSSDGKTIYWYNSTDAEYQLNRSGVTYYWIALG